MTPLLVLAGLAALAAVAVVAHIAWLMAHDLTDDGEVSEQWRDTHARERHDG